jgi:outer membrane protein TolC
MRLSILFFSFFLSTCLVGEEPVTLSFQEVLKLAKANNLDLLKSEQGALVKSGDYFVAQSALFPKISFNLSNSFGYQARDFDHNSMGLNLYIPLFDGKKLLDAKASFEENRAAKERHLYATESMISKLGELYINVLQLEASKNIAKEEWEQNQQQLRVLQNKLEVGRARKLDILRTQYLVSKAQSDYLLKEQELFKKMGELGQEIGQKGPFSLEMVEIDSVHLKKGQGELLAMAEVNQETLAIQRELKSLDLSLTGEMLDFLPKLSMTADAGFRDQNIFLKEHAGFRVMFNLELPIFSGGSSFGHIRSKHAQKVMGEITVRKTSAQNALTIEGIVKDLENQNQVNDSLSQALAAALEAKNSAERMFKENQATSLEMTEANTNLSNAKTESINAKLKFELLKLKLLVTISKAHELL